MKTQIQRAALTAAVSASVKTASLRSASAFSGASVKVDEEKGTILGAAIMTIGTPEGFPWTIDATTLQQTRDLINASPGGLGVKSRFMHPPTPVPGEPMPEDLGTVIGRVRNARIDGSTLRGDVYLGAYANKLPGLGDVRSYLLARAKEDPSGFGLSAAIWFDLEPVTSSSGTPEAMVARVVQVDAVDFVGRGAATPDGLLSSLQPTGPIMNQTLKQILCSMGLAYDASDEAATAFHDALSDTQKQDIQGRLKAIAAAAQVEAEQAAVEAGATGQMAAKVAAAVVKRMTKPTGVLNMDPKIKACLCAHFGLAAGASDDDAQKLYNEKKADVDAKVAQLAAVAGTGAGGGVDPNQAVIAALATMTPEQVAALTAKATQLAAKPARGDAGDEFLALEGKRVAQLQQLGTTLSVDADVIKQAIAEGDDAIKARTRYLTHLQQKCKPIDGLSVGEDRNRASLRAALPQAMLRKIGVRKIYAFDHLGHVQRDDNNAPVVEKMDERAIGLSEMRMRDLLGEHLAALGVESREIRRMGDGHLVKAFNRRGIQELFPRVAQLAQGFDDFDSILANVQNKALRIAYAEMSPTWKLWCGRRTAPDFKQISDVQVSDVPDLVAKDEHGRYRRVQISDSKEVWTLAEYGVIIAFTRKAMLNDDLNVFGSVPQKQAAAAMRLEETRAYLTLTANATMFDTGALFNATAYTTAGGHQNLDSATAYVGAPSVTTLGYGRSKMRLQVGPKGSILNIIPKFLIVPSALENVAEQYTSANYVAAIQTSINPFSSQGRTPLVPIVQPRLDATSATQWYLAADPTQIDTVKLCFLESEQEPSLTQNVDFHSDDLELKVRHSVANAALDHRGLYRNNGS